MRQGSMQQGHRLNFNFTAKSQDRKAFKSVLHFLMRYFLTKWSIYYHTVSQSLMDFTTAWLTRLEPGCCNLHTINLCMTQASNLCCAPYSIDHFSVSNTWVFGKGSTALLCIVHFHYAALHKTLKPVGTFTDCHTEKHSQINMCSYVSLI